MSAVILNAVGLHQADLIVHDTLNHEIREGHDTLNSADAMSSLIAEFNHNIIHIIIFITKIPVFRLLDTTSLRADSANGSIVQK